MTRSIGGCNYLKRIVWEFSMERGMCVSWNPDTNMDICLSYSPYNQKCFVEKVLRMVYMKQNNSKLVSFN